MAKKKRRNKRKDLHAITGKYMKKFDNLMNAASKEIRKGDFGCSSHVLSSLVIRHCSYNMTRYYDVLKVRDLFQDILDEESTYAVVKAKADREEATLH